MCPVCNFDHNDNILDTCYPANRERTIFNTYCQSSNGGCDRIIYGRTMEESIERWANPENLNEFNLSIEEVKKNFAIEKIKNKINNFN